MLLRLIKRVGIAPAVLVSPLMTVASNAQNLTLKSALQRALNANPRLTTAAREMGIASSLRLQAGARPNPELSFELDNAFGTRNGQGVNPTQATDTQAQQGGSENKPKDYRGLRAAETTLQIGQLIELGGKREARIAVGAAGESVAYWQYRAAELDLLSEAASAFILVVALQRKIEIFDEQIAVFDPLLPLLEKRVREGASSPAETLRARAAVEMYRVERTRTQTQCDIARRELAILMGDPTPRFTRAIGRLGTTGTPPTLQRVIAAIDSNPQLSRWTAIVAQRDAELESAKSKAIPDVRVYAGWRHYNETKDNGVRLGLSVPLPLFDGNVGNIRAAQDNISKAAAEWSGARLSLIGAASRAHASLVGSQQELRQLRENVLPSARGAAEAISSGYSQGRFSLLELLDSRNALVQALLREQETLQAFHLAVAAIEGLIGNPLAIAQEISK